MSIAREEAYRTLAAESAGSQQRVAQQQDAIESDLAILRTKIDGIEKLLRGGLRCR